MSLINEALKKAQRMRNEEVAAPSLPVLPDAPAPRIPKRGKATNANTLVLLGSAALVLVVLSVVATVYLVNRPSDTARVASTPTPATVAPTASPTTTASASPATEASPVIVPPAVTAPASTAAAETPAVASTSAPAVTSPVLTPATPKTPTETASATTVPVPAATSNPSTAAASTAKPPVADPTAPDERVAAFVDAVRVTGIRSSGSESRVLMNERVYRVNDIVERTLGVKLIKASADSLTFADPRGVTYVKHF